VENERNKNQLLLNLIAVSLIVFTGLIIYSNSFNCGWHFDDEPSIINNLAIKDISNIKAISSFDPSRFVTVFSLALNWHFGGQRVLGYHVVNLIIHLTAAIFVWWLALLLLKTPALKNKDYKNGSFFFPLFIGLIFVAHPVQTQAVTYIIQRAAALAALFYTASVVFYIKYRLAEKHKSLYYTLALVACVLGMFSKELVFTLPFMLIAIEFFFFKAEGKFSFKPLVPFLFTLAIIPVVIIFVHSTALKETSEASGKISSVTYLLTQFQVIVTYLRLYVLPVNLNLDYDYPLAKSFFEFKTLLSFLFLVLIMVFGVIVYKKNRLISFGIFWFFLTLAVESSILPIKDVIYEHRLYLPMIGLTFTFIALLYELLNGKNVKYLAAMIGVIVILLSYASYQRNFVWENEITLWTDVIQKSPNKYRAYINRGLDYQRHFALDKAMADLEKGLSLDPNNAIAYCNIGAIYGLKEERETALECFNKAITLDPKYEEAYNNRGSIYFQLGQYDKAIADFNTAMRLKPKSPTGYNNRGTLYFMLGKYDEALVDYMSALKIDYQSRDILKNIGLTYSKMGKYEMALEYFNKSLEYGPNNPFVLFNRAVVYYIIKKPELAKKDIQQMKSMGIDAESDFEGMIKSLNLNY